MPKFGPHIPQIQDKVQERIIDLGLIPKYVFNAGRHHERFYTVPCRNKNGKKVMLKIRTEDYALTKEFFRREIRINEVFTKHFSGGDLYLPKYLNGDANHEPEWMLYEFIEGSAPGDFYNGMEGDNLKKFSIASMVLAFNTMHEMSVFSEIGKKGIVKLEEAAYADYEKAYEKYKSRLEPFFSEDEIARGKEILELGRDLLDKQDKVVTHGDLHPGNMIVRNDGGIAVIDWYYVRMDNAAFDLAFLALEIPDKEFRNRLLNEFIDTLVVDKEKFWQYFRLDVLRIAPQKINVLCDSLYTYAPKKEDYYAKLTPRGVAKLDLALDFFRRAISGVNFIDDENENENRNSMYELNTGTGA